MMYISLGASACATDLGDAAAACCTDILSTHDILWTRVGVGVGVGVVVGNRNRGRGRGRSGDHSFLIFPTEWLLLRGFSKLRPPAQREEDVIPLLIIIVMIVIIALILILLIILIILILTMNPFNAMRRQLALGGGPDTGTCLGV